MKIEEAIKKGLAQIESLGKGLTKKPEAIKKLSTGIESLDNALDGGWAAGRIHEIYGGESCGKSTLCLYTIKKTQESQKKTGHICAYVDAEHSFDPAYAEFIGVKTQDLQMVYPNWGEQALEAVRILAMTGKVDLIIVDSVACLCPRSEYEGNINEGQMGAQPAMLSKGLRQINADLHNNNTTVIFINQLREKLGIMYGNPETTPGGRALKHHATQRLAVRAGEKLKDGDKEIGFIIKVKCGKNKAGVAQRTAELAYYHGKAISVGHDKFNAGISSGTITQAGSFYTLSDGRKIQGRQSVIDLLDKEHVV